MIAVMARERWHAFLGRAAGCAVLSLAIAVSGCGGDTSAPDGRVLADAGHDLVDGSARADSGASPADAPTSPVHDAAESPMSDAADGPVRDAAVVDLAGVDGDEVDTPGLDGPSGADGGAAETVAPADALVGDLEPQKRDSASDIFVDPACASADSAGFFASCTSCTDPGNCDSITVGSRMRQACGCEDDSDCPCGLRCGCYAIVSSVQVCGICTR